MTKAECQHEYATEDEVLVDIINKAIHYETQADKFNGLSRSQAVYAITTYANTQISEALWDLHEYMGQFPDDLNLAVMDERIKLIEQEMGSSDKSNSLELGEIIDKHAHFLTQSDMFKGLSTVQAKHAIQKLIDKRADEAYVKGFMKASKGAFKSRQEAKRIAVEELLDRLEASISSHTTPEGRDLITRSYVKNTLNFERNKLRGVGLYGK